MVQTIYDIIKAHGEELKVETKVADPGSSGNGEGTEFYYSIAGRLIEWICRCVASGHIVTTDFNPLTMIKKVNENRRFGLYIERIEHEEACKLWSFIRYVSSLRLWVMFRILFNGLKSVFTRYFEPTALVKTAMILKAHGGELKVEMVVADSGSSRKGEGTEFIIGLPVG